jgi:hypothetical protein
VEERGPLGFTAISVARGELQHRVLHEVERFVARARRDLRDAKGARFDAGEEAVERRVPFQRCLDSSRVARSARPFRSVPVRSVPAIEAIMAALAAAVESFVDAIAAPVEALVDAVALRVEPVGAALVAVRVGARAAAVEAAFGAVAAVVEARVDAVATPVEALLDPVATIGRRRPCGGDEQQEGSTCAEKGLHRDLLSRETALLAGSSPDNAPAPRSVDAGWQAVR